MGNKLIVSIHIPLAGKNNFKFFLNHFTNNHILYDDAYKPLLTGYTERRIKNKKNIDNKCMKLQAMMDDINYTGYVALHGQFLATDYESYFDRNDCKYIIWLRDPIQRITSHYLYWKYAPDKNNKICQETRGQTIEEFAQHEKIKNIYTRFLNGVDINTVDFIGMQDDYDTSMNLFRVMFGVDHTIKTPAKKMKHPYQKAKEKYKITNTYKNIVNQNHSDDIAIYNAALAKYNNLVQQYLG